jgi:CelD/BcsL family acetyltransferase involved in cellulose biosynthesis
MTLTADAPVLAALLQRVHQAGRVGRRAAWRLGLRQGALALRYHLIGEHFAQRLWLMPSYKGGEWARYAPDRLLLEHLLEWNFKRGLRAFDCTIGDEPYKATWCNQTDHLYRLIRPRSASGWAYYAHSRLFRPTRRRLATEEETRAAAPASPGTLDCSHAPC